MKLVSQQHLSNPLKEQIFEQIICNIKDMDILYDILRKNTSYLNDITTSQLFDSICSEEGSNLISIDKLFNNIKIWTNYHEMFVYLSSLSDLDIQAGFKQRQTYQNRSNLDILTKQAKLLSEYYYLNKNETIIEYYSYHKKCLFYLKEIEFIHKQKYSEIIFEQYLNNEDYRSETISKFIQNSGIKDVDILLKTFGDCIKENKYSSQYCKNKLVNIFTEVNDFDELTAETGVILKTLFPEQIIYIFTEALAPICTQNYQYLFCFKVLNNYIYEGELMEKGRARNILIER